MADATITRDGARAHAESVRLFTRLVFLGNPDEPTAVSSSHALDDIDEVRFQRGPRRAERQIAGTVRTLVLSFPDGRMSSSHGCLTRHGTQWLLEDPASKNGAIVNGAPLRKVVLGDDTLIELGHSFFLFRQTEVPHVPGHLAGDVDATQLPDRAHGMATFEPVLAIAFGALRRLGPSPVSILIQGETGTGKEVVARGIHALAGRSGPFVAVNCGALPPALVEAELFGHRRGAFSGAVADRKGLIRSAEGGTLFLDEIAELGPASQAALLRVHQEREVLPVGEDKPIKIDVRMIAATLRDLEAAVAEDRFRVDLYARIAGHVIQLPPLRERREDLGLLIHDLMVRHAAGAIRIAPATLRMLVCHDWPLNIRSLEQMLTTAANLAEAGVIEPEHLPAPMRFPRATPPSPAAGPVLAPADRELRAKLIALFTEHEGNVVAVATAFGKRRTQIYKWVDRLEIDLAAFRRSP